MIEWTSGFGLALVTFIMIAMGLFLFLFPPVPGMPIYMAFGIMLPAQAQQQMGESRVDQTLCRLSYLS